MRYGILADVHANASALRTALDHLARAKIDKILFLGDLIGYGGQPAESVSMLMERTDVLAICGNHDRQLFDPVDPHMRRTAVTALEWTRSVLSPAQMEYLRALPQGLTVDDQFIMVHGSLSERDAYILNSTQVNRNLKVLTSHFPAFHICFFGHTHSPMLVSNQNAVMEARETKTYQLKRDDTYLINPGSAGQPRDNCPFASFGLFDADKWTMTFFRVPYDIRNAQEAIMAAGLPEKFAKRLAAGR
jgi:diadenosine tetraphosphatase ApaH/serine/threonine PP2A family protein phosphatase